MKTWTIIFTSVVAGIIVAAGLLFVVRGQIQKWEAAETKAISSLDEAIASYARERNDYGASKMFLSIQSAGLTMADAPLWANHEPLRKKCVEAAEQLNRYRASQGLPPYTLREMWGRD